MRRPQQLALGLAATAALLALGMRFGWFSGEPTYRGRTVSAWLSRLNVYDTEAGVNTDGERWIKLVARPAEVVTNDPAFRALGLVGAKAVPALTQIIQERADWPPETGAWTKTRQWVEWKWNRWRSGGMVPRPAPKTFSRTQIARKTTAGVVLLALGTSAHAGFPAFAQAYADAPKHQSIYGTPVPGAPIGLISSDVVRLGKAFLPQRQDELVAGILASLQHSNPWCRTVALEVIGEYPEEFHRWKDELLQRTLDEDQLVRETALGRLLWIAQDKRLSISLPPYQIEMAAEAVAQDARTDPRVRRLAGQVREAARNAVGESNAAPRFMRTMSVSPRRPWVPMKRAQPPE